MALAAGALAVGVLTGGAHGAGTGGLEVTPVRDDGASTFRVEVPREGSVDVPFLLRNVDEEPRSGRVYTARVTSTDGAFALDAPDSSPYLVMPDREVTLQPGEVREQVFRVQAGPDGGPEGEEYAAVVVEVRNGSVVQRASTLVYLRGERVVPLPLLLVVLAVVLLLAAGAGVAAVARRRSQHAER